MQDLLLYLLQLVQSLRYEIKSEKNPKSNEKDKTTEKEKEKEREKEIETEKGDQNLITDQDIQTLSEFCRCFFALYLLILASWQNLMNQ